MEWTDRNVATPAETWDPKWDTSGSDQWRIQKFWKEGGGRKTIYQLHPHLSQMRTTKYMLFTRKKAVFWQKCEPIGGPRPPPIRTRHWIREYGKCHKYVVATILTVVECGPACVLMHLSFIIMTVAFSLQILQQHTESCRARAENSKFRSDIGTETY